MVICIQTINVLTDKCNINMAKRKPLLAGQNIIKLIDHFLVTDVKASIVSNMVGLPHQQQLPSGYMNHQPDQQHPSHHTPHAPVSPPHQMHPKGYSGYGGSEPPKLNHPPSAASSMTPVAMTQLSAQMLPAQVSG